MVDLLRWLLKNLHIVTNWFRSSDQAGSKFEAKYESWIQMNANVLNRRPFTYLRKEDDIVGDAKIRKAKNVEFCKYKIHTSVALYLIQLTFE